MADVVSKITLKLLIDTRNDRVIFGEAGKDFVDFIFSLLTLPLATVIKLLSPPTMVGSIGNLYQSVQNLNETYLADSTVKSSLLHPKVSTFDVASPLLLGTERKLLGTKRNDSPPAFSYPSKFSSSGQAGNEKTSFSFSSSSASSSLFGFSGPSPPVFGYSISPSPSLFSSSAEDERESVRGFVKEVITYMITDNLEVTPMSAISSITLINRFNVKDAQFEEKAVIVGMKEGLALLKASLESPTVLSDVFCSSTKNTKAQSHAADIDA